MFEPRISAGAVEKHPCSGKQDAENSSWSYVMDCHAKKCVSDIASWRTKHSSNCTKLQLHPLMTINSKKSNLDLLENCHKYALKLS